MNPSRLTRDSILEAFSGYGAPRTRWRIGGEFERILVHADGRPVMYDDPNGIRWLLERLVEAGGWKPYFENGNPIALNKDGASITLEPGGQVELSGAPHNTLVELVAESRTERDQLRGLLAGTGIRPLSVGLHPFAAIEDIGWMPKGRYRIMREWMPGDRALYMMKGTASVQCNYDYSDEADCAEKVRLCAQLSPLTTALFANSPLYRGKPTGYLSYRGHIWTRTDPDRCGFPPGLRDDYTHARWVDYLLDVPMMFYVRDGAWLPAHGTPFRRFMTEGIDGHFPAASDWELHMTSVFPEVRIKRTIEVRGADCVPWPLALSFCAFFTALLYDDDARNQALVLAGELAREGTRESRLDGACRHGLQAVISGRSLQDWAKDLGALAVSGLSRWEPASVSLLDPLLANIEVGRTPAERILELWEHKPAPASLIEQLAY